MLAIVLALVSCNFMGCSEYNHEHSYSATVIESTCVNRGYTIYTCKCGDEYRDEYTAINPNSHNYVYDTVESTCEEEGYEYGRCVGCGEGKMDVLEPLGHNIIDILETVDATCEKPGYKAGLCDKCNNIVVVEEPALGHKQGEILYSSELCGSQQIGTVSCARCNQNIYSFGHTYQLEIIDPTCTTDGMRIYTCSSCNESYTETISSYGHFDINWTIVAEASCELEGIAHKICEICGEITAIASLDKTEHEYSTSEFCDGHINYTCSVCDHQYSVETNEIFTVTFNPNGGEEIDPLIVSANTSIVLPTPEREGFEFSGWYFDSEFINACPNTYTFEENTELYADWHLSFIEGEITTNSVLTNVPKNYVFAVIGDVELTNENIDEYIFIQNGSGERVKIYIEFFEDNKYTIASDEYENGEMYIVNLPRYFHFAETYGNELTFTIESENYTNIEYNENIQLIDINDIVNLHSNDDKQFVFLAKDMIDVDDNVVVFDGDIYNPVFVFAVASEIYLDGYYVYEIKEPDYDKVFDKYEMFYSGEVENLDFDLSEEEEEQLIQALVNSKVYENFEDSVQIFSAKMSNNKESFKHIKTEKKVSPVFQNGKIGVNLALIAHFAIIDNATGKEKARFDITTSIYFAFGIKGTSNVKSIRDFSVTVTTTQNFRFEIYAKSSDANPVSDNTLSFFKKMFQNIYSKDGRFDNLNDSLAELGETINLGAKTVPLWAGFSGTVAISMSEDLEVVGQIGAFVELSSQMTTSFTYNSSGFRTNKSFNSNVTAGIYAMAKMKYIKTIDFTLRISFLCTVHADITASVGPYYEVGGMFGLTYNKNNGAWDASASGYFEAGIEVNVDLRLSVRWDFKKIVIRRFRIYTEPASIVLLDKSITLFNKQFPLVGVGVQETPISFEDYEDKQELTIDCKNPQFDLKKIISSGIVVQDLKSLKIKNTSANCSFHLQKSHHGIALAQDGTLKITDKSLDFAIIDVKIVYKNIFKCVRIYIYMDHDWTESQAKAATCTSAGWDKYSSCSLCGYTTYEEIAALGHDYKVVASIEPTCTEEGFSLESRCDRCKVVVSESQTLPALGHKESEWKIDIAPTCYNEGSKHTECVRCHIKMSEEVIPKPQHSIVKVASQLPTCVNVGWKAYEKCSNCDYTTYDEIPATGHTLTSTVIQPTCENEGYTILNCKCGYSETTNHVSPLGHNYSAWYTTLVPTCNSVGSEKRNCTRCSYYEKREIPKKQHSYAENVTEPTCTERGYTTYVCACGDTYIDNYVDKKKHTEVIEEALEATCSSTGLTEGKHCSDCGTVLVAQEVVPMKEHILGDWYEIIAPTCTTTGTNRRDCLNCEYYEVIVVSSFGHTPGEVVVENHIAPDCVNNGSYDNVVCCTVCEEEISRETVVLEALGHNYESVVTEPTCTEQGHTTFTCHCGDTYIGDYTPKAPHSWGEWEIVLEPTKDEEGLKERTCECGEKESEIIPAYGFSQGLEYGLNDDRQSYYVVSVGDCEDLEVIIPNSYNGLPVTHIGRWAFKNCNSIVSVYIPDSVTSIGIEAFEDSSSLEMVELGDSVTEIREYAFQNCTSLKNVIIGDAVKIIGKGAFSGCVSLTNVEMGISVENIGYAAFRDCKLTSISIPNSVQIIDEFAFSKCNNIKNVHYTGDVSDWCSIEFKGNYSNPTSYGADLYFNNELLIDVIIPTNITYIDEYRFVGCTSLKTVTITNSVTTISGGFGNCTSLETIIIPNSVTVIDNHAFSGCTSLNNVCIPDSVEILGYGVFNKCDSLTQMSIPNSVTTIGDFAFNMCKSLLTIDIPQSVTSIGYSSFISCTSLEAINFGGTIEQWQSISLGDYWNTNTASYIIYCTDGEIAKDGTVTYYQAASKGLEYELDSDGQSYSVTGIGTCRDKDIVIPSEYMGLPVSCIGQIAFLEADFIETIFIPDTVVQLDYLPFPLCNSLVSIEVSSTHPCFVSIDGDLYIREGIYPNFEGKTVYQYALGKTNTTFTIPQGVGAIAPGAFASCLPLEEIVVSEGVTYIEYAAFAMCGSLKKITMPITIEYLGPALFEESVNVDTIKYMGTVGQWNNMDKDQDWDLGMGEYIIYCIDGEIAKDGTTTYYATGSEGLQYALNDDGQSYSLTGIGTCVDTDIVIPRVYNGLPVTGVTYQAFAECSNIVSVIFPDSITDMGIYMFTNCTSLKKVVFNNNLESIPHLFFWGCTALEDVVIPDSVTSIGMNAFYECKSLKNLVIPENVNNIGRLAFFGCESLDNVVFENPNNWEIVFETIETPAIYPTAEALQNPQTAAEYLSQKGVGYEWYRKE